MKPSIAKGTRDFSPTEMLRREHIFSTIREVFKLHGYQPIETPAMELTETLMGKYGEEGDRLIFRILNSGDFLRDVPSDLLVNRQSPITNQISEKALRYDLTVPFARYVVMNRNEITFPFKRYQIQPVWRADRPQRGRYREFYQCDADVIGSDSLLNEVELIQILDGVFKRLRIPVVVKLNNRKLLQAVAEAVGAPDRFVDITVTVDKLEKIGLEKVEAELCEKGLSGDSIIRLRPLMLFEGENEAKVNFLRQFLAGIEVGTKGLEELTEVMNTARTLVSPNLRLEFDLTLARGLNYYTGAIIEVKSAIPDTLSGSICGGGRYDDLTGIFGMPGISGVGISFGADRIHDVMLEARLFPETLAEGPRILFVNFGDAEAHRCLELLANLRSAGIVAELYPDQAKMKKQMGYADTRNIPFVAIIGENELREGTVTLKDMRSGEQHTISAHDMLHEVNI